MHCWSIIICQEDGGTYSRMARCRRLDRSMPCFSSPLSRVARALVAFLQALAH